MTHKGTSTLETEQLILRRFTPEDAAAMFRNFFSAPIAVAPSRWQPHESVAATKELMTQYQAEYEDLDCYNWAIVKRDIFEPIGRIAVSHMDERISAVDMSCFIGREWWRKGYASETLAAVIKYLFEDVGINRIVGRHDVANPNSGGVMKKCNMRFEGVLRQAGRNSNGLVDVAQYAILAEDYHCQEQPFNIAAITRNNYIEYNSVVIDRWTDENWIWSQPVSHEVYEAAKRGEWSVLLTPTKPIPREWFAPFLRHGSFDGAKILGLACGGGQQMPIFTALGAKCTVLDYSRKMLDQDRLVAAREDCDIHIVRADMTERLPFDDGVFDLIFHPVSNSYIEDDAVYHVWKECYRVLKRGGVLLAGFDNGFDYLLDDYSHPLTVQNTYPFNPLKNAEQMAKLIANDSGVQFSHGISEQIGGQLAAGLRLTNVFDDIDTGAAAGDYPSYWATRAVKE